MNKLIIIVFILVLSTFAFSAPKKRACGAKLKEISCKGVKAAKRASFCWEGNPKKETVIKYCKQTKKNVKKVKKKNKVVKKSKKVKAKKVKVEEDN